MTTRRKSKFIDHSDPLDCQTKPRLSYCAFFEDADRRAAEGQQQKYCDLCRRYRWSDEECERFQWIGEAEERRMTEEAGL